MLADTMLAECFFLGIKVIDHLANDGLVWDFASKSTVDQQNSPFSTLILRTDLGWIKIPSFFVIHKRGLVVATSSILRRA